MEPTYTVTEAGHTTHATAHYADLIRDLLSRPTPDMVAVSHQGRLVATVYDGQVIER